MINSDPGAVRIDEGSRARGIRRVLGAVLLLNVAVAVAKLVVGGWASSISMVADGFHSLTDGASNVIGLIGIRWASHPPDEDHPYGHWKVENLAALLIGGLLAMTAWEILQSCFDRLVGGGTPEVTSLTFAVMLTTLAVNLAVSTYERRAARRWRSHLLAADAAHTRSDVYVSLGVIASLLAARYGYPWADVLAAVVITGVIGWTAFKILRDSAGQLTDVAAVSAAQVRELALTVPGVLGVHKVRSRRRPGGTHADLHVQVAPDLALDRAHVIGHNVAHLLEEELGLSDVVVHVEPPEGHRTSWTPDG